MPRDVTDRIVIRPGYCGGKPHIAGHRIKVQHIAVSHSMGMSPEEIAEQLPTITLADVHAALAYYYDHRLEIEDDIAEEDRFVAELKAKSPPSPLQERLRQVMRDAADDSLPSG